ncbi:unnamed protein product [Ambrosiozyma monospora]|uniref:Unnamed protein product n=1 Tax=Ambrosiozyma monospora TaxID=43982 RepID=A0ACB5T7W1_AMBMO|nr:unnamed protein product [Ambrosiozyma monospora]
MTPVKYLLHERLSLKTQRRLDELLRRFSLGLNKNEEAASSDIIILCHEIYTQAIDYVNENIKKKKEEEVDEKVEHFLVQLDARPVKTQLEYSLYIRTMQKFSFELLRTAITKHNSLFTVANLSSFVPLLASSLTSDDEGVVISALKLFTMLVRLDFPEETDRYFTTAARQVMRIIKDMPSTNNELCQACLRFMSAVIRHKEDLKLKNTAISYILKKVEPDLDEPMRQGVAFGFVKSLIAKHFMLAEIYDTMDIVSKIMITSTSKEIMEVSRSVFFTFLMEYDQSRGRLEKQFKMLINNLEYPAQSGRQSVLELLHLIVNKAGKELLQKLGSSFFIALANSSISDDSPNCREMASETISLILTKLSQAGGDLTFIEKYICMWLKQNKNELLTRCGLHMYSLYAVSVGYDSNEELNEIALTKITSILKAARKSDDASSVDVAHELVYISLTTLEKLKGETNLFEAKFENIWKYVVDGMLYPHSWIRLASSRLVGSLLLEIDENNGSQIEFEITDSFLQTIALRLFRQLSAPDVSETLAAQVAKNLVYLSKKWNKDNTQYIQKPHHEMNPDKLKIY